MQKILFAETKSPPGQRAIARGGRRELGRSGASQQSRNGQSRSDAVLTPDLWGHATMRHSRSTGHSGAPWLILAEPTEHRVGYIAARRHRILTLHGRQQRDRGRISPIPLKAGWAQGIA